MQIKIEGYRNIEKLDFEIADNKLNFLFGVSGSGKSSIALAARQEDIDFNKKVNYSALPTILINGKSAVKEDTIVFNSQSVENYLVNDINDEAVFNIIVDDERELNIEQNKFDKYMLGFQKRLDAHDDLYRKLKEISTDVVGTLTSRGEMRSSSKIKQLEKNFNGKNNPRVVKEINDMDSKKFDWLLQGYSHIDEKNNCPFCNKMLSKRRIAKLAVYSSFDSKNLKIIREKSNQFLSVGIPMPIYTSNGIQKLGSELHKASIAVREYEKIKLYLEYIGTEKDITNIKHIDVDSILFDFFPDLRNIVVGLNNNIDRIKEASEKANLKTSEVLNKKVTDINELIKILGIPYSLEVQYKKRKIKSYRLKHNDDPGDKDRRKSLSNGEKNLIALVIFILDVKKNGANKLCIIDDPVSSFDECRRKIIFEFIKSYLKTSTVLILSHDNVFARIATSNLNSKYVGSIFYFENNNGIVNLINIGEEDFNKFDDFLIVRAKKSSEYFQKVINLRMLYEGSNSSYAYSYLSKIIHFYDETKINDWIIAKNTTEARIIEDIKSKYEVDLPPFDRSLRDRINLQDYSLIEKAALIRENTDKKPSSFRNELNHLLHVGDRQVVCLNPHKFSFCSSNTRVEIESHIDLLTSIQLT